MILGILAVWLGLAATLTATLSYFMAMRARLAEASRQSAVGSRQSRRAERKEQRGRTVSTADRRPPAADWPPSPSVERLELLARRAFNVSAACAFATAAVF